MAFAGATRAERDLRDAFRAIKLMRADLEQTRAEKEQLAVAAARWGEQAAAAREAALMREEDFQAQLERIARVHAAQLAMSSVVARAADCPDAERRVQSCGERPEAASDDEEQDATSKLSRDNQLDNDGAPGVEEGGGKEKVGRLVTGNNNEEQSVMELLADELAQEKLHLQAEIQRLGHLLEERTSALLEERVRVSEVQQELELSREEAERGLVDSHAIAEDLAREKQHVEEKYEFLHTELDVLKQDQREWKEKLRVAEDARLELEQAVDDMRATHQLKMIAAQNSHQTERAQLVDEIDALKAQLASASSMRDADLMEQIQQELAAMGEQLELRDSEITKLREELTRVQETLHSTQKSHDSSAVQMKARLESFSQTSMILKGQLMEKEEEAARLRVSLREQEEELQSLRADCADLHESSSGVRKENDALQSTLQHQAEEAAAEYSYLQRAFREQEARMKELRHDNHELEIKMKAVQLVKEQVTQELESVRQKLQQAEDEVFAQRDELLQLRDRCDRLEQDLLASSSQLKSVVSERKHAADDMKRQLEQELQDAHATNVTLSGQLNEIQTQAEAYEQECKNLSMEKKALQQELRQIKLSAKLAKDELVNAQSHIDDLEHQLFTLQHQDEVDREHFHAVSHHLEAFERTAMQLEDCRHLDENDALDALFGSNVEAAASTLSSGHVTFVPAAVWSVVKQKITELDKFLPLLQSFAVFLDDALCACESNATTLSDLCAQFEQAGRGGAARDSSLLQDVIAYVRFACQLQQTVLSRDPEFANHARRFHRRVFEVMAHWCEVTDHDEIPAPPVAIASREVALILANWTRDKAKRVSTRQWLEQVEAIGSASDELSAELGMDGTTLVLDDMTVEVKQAFLMLIVPILRRNPAVFVRVFTRLVSPPRSLTRTTIALLEDKRWEMKIHVQPSVRPVSSMTSMHPPVLSLDAAGSYAFERSPVSPSSVSSSSTSSSATSFASARLQIIQERLQRMQSR